MGNISTNKLYKIYDEFEEAISAKALMQLREKICVRTKRKRIYSI